MTELDKAKTVVDFYVLCNSLKDLIRKGWQNWNVERDRVESVAEHIFGVQSLAIAMWSQYAYELDIQKVIFMLAVHELEEILIGDLTIWEIDENDRVDQGHLAINKVLKDLIKKEDISSLVHEFDARETKEAKFAYFCDKLECDIQAKLYDEENCVNILKQESNPRINDASLQKRIKEGKSWSEIWIEEGRERYNYDSSFAKVSEYIEKNDIGIKIKKRGK